MLDMSLEWLEKQIRERHHGKRYGDIQSFFLWNGTQIEDFRVYAPWDSPRNINRKMSAKHDTLWINKRNQDTDLPVHIILDINTNRSWWIYENNRSIVRQWLADYILFARTYHVWKTTVWFPWTDWRIASMVCSTQEEWLQGYVQRESCVERMSLNSIHVSLLWVYMKKQMAQRRKQIYLFFSDFLAMDQNLQKKMNYSDQHNALLHVHIDVPEFLDQYLV